jgi:hypothetical protein
MKNKTFLIYILLISLFGLNKSGFADVPIKLSLTSGSSAPAKIKEGKIIYHKDNYTYVLTEKESGNVFITAYQKEDYHKYIEVELKQDDKSLNYVDYFLQKGELYILMSEFDRRKKTEYLYYRHFDLKKMNWANNLVKVISYEKKRKIMPLIKYKIVESVNKEFILIMFENNPKNFFLIKNGQEYKGDLAYLLEKAYSEYKITDVLIINNEKAVVAANLDTSYMDFQILYYRNSDTIPERFEYSFDLKIHNGYREAKLIQTNKGSIVYGGYIVKNEGSWNDVNIGDPDYEFWKTDKYLCYGTFAIELDSMMKSPVGTCKLYAFTSILREKFREEKEKTKGKMSSFQKIGFDAKKPIDNLHLVDLLVSNEDEIFILGQEHIKLTDLSEPASPSHNPWSFGDVVVTGINLRADTHWHNRIKHSSSGNYGYNLRFNYGLIYNNLVVLTSSWFSGDEIPLAKDCSSSSSINKCQFLLFYFELDGTIKKQFYYSDDYNQRWYAAYNVFSAEDNSFYLTGRRSMGLKLSKLTISLNE